MRKSYLFSFQYMACALTQGYTNDCRDSIGGAKTFHIIEHANVEDIEITANVVTDITKAIGKRFFKYKPAKNTSYAKETITGNAQNGTVFYAQELFLALTKMQTNTRNEILLLAQNDIMVVATDANGKHWLYGYQNGLTVSGGEAGTGTASGDRNGYTVTLTGEEPALAIEVDAATFTALETAGV